MKTRSTIQRFRFVAASAASAALALAITGCSNSDTATTPQATGTVPSQSAKASVADKLPANVKSAGVIKIGTEALYPPFESFAGDNKTIVGLDPDLAAALGQVLGVKVQFTHTAFDGLLTALEGNRFDMVMAAITDTKVRQSKFDFVDYFMTGQAIVVKKGNPKGIKTVADMCGKNVSVLSASTQLKLLNEFNTKDCASNKINVAAFPSDKDALLQVQTGRADASFTQDATGAYNAKTIGGGNQFEIANTEPLEPTAVGMVFGKDDTQLRDALQAALKEVISNGSYEQVLGKYGLTSGIYRDASINGGTK